MKKLLTLLMSALLVVIMIPSAVFADNDLESDYQILFSANSYSYRGTPIEADFFVVTKDGPSWMLYDSFVEGGELYDVRDDYILPESNYTYEYENNTEVGEAKLTVKGKGEYSGTLTGIFSISPRVNEKLKVTVNDDKSVTIEPLAEGLKAKDVTKVMVWLGAVDDDYTLTKGSEYKVASDGAVTITKKFLTGDTGFKAMLGKIKIRIETDNYLGYAKVGYYNISAIQYWDDSPLVYNGKNRSVKVSMDGFKRGRDFKVIYAKSKRKEIGTYYYTIKGIGDCCGTAKGSFKINPKRPSKVTASLKSKKAEVKWKKVANCTGYQVQLVYPSEEDSDMISYEIYQKKTIKNKNKTSTVFEKAKRSKYSRVRVRSYKTVKGKKYYSKWKYL